MEGGDKQGVNPTRWRSAGRRRRLPSTKPQRRSDFMEDLDPDHQVWQVPASNEGLMDAGRVTQVILSRAQPTCRPFKSTCTTCGPDPSIISLHGPDHTSLLLRPELDAGFQQILFKLAHIEELDLLLDEGDGLRVNSNLITDFKL
ncbi:hypothetical protein BaRGS_00011360 [Batillaria attramentaria]|uniref:Uncharacterized protein n=1 Tax=Batillaria attramentaria TaxID=370345 RepID=A0ABD0LD86_9CAEN